MDSSFSSEVRKSNFEELSKEELLKKCKGLLTIAQKAKQAKDLLQEENAKLKQELASKVEIRVSEELVETLTQQKLSLVTAIEDLKARNSSLDSKLQIYEQELKTCQEKLDKADNESVSYKRQVTRLTDENEQLLTHLDSLEKQIDELNKIGIQQRKQLLELESKAQGQGNVTDENRFTELQCMLSVSLDEVKKLKSQNIGLNEKVDNVNMALSEKNKNMLILGEDLKTNCHTLEKVNKELDLLQDMKKELEAKLAELQSRNDKLKEKLKLYHSKIIKLAGTTKGLKEEKEAILELFKRYTDQVKDWKEQLNNAVKGLVEHIGVIHYENRKLKADLKQKFDFDMEKVLNETVMKYEAQLGSLRNENEAVKNKLEGSEVRCTSLHQAVKESRKNIDEYKIQMDVLQTENENLDKDLVSQKNLNAQLVEELAAIKGENVRLAKDLGEFEAKCSSLNKEMKSLLDSNKELKNEINLLVNEKKSGNMIIKEKDAASNKQMEEYQSMLLDNEKLICDLQVQLKSYEYDREHVKATEMKLAEKSSEEIIKLVEEKKKILELNVDLQKKLDDLRRQVNVHRYDIETQTGDDLIPSSDFEEQLINLKHENTELLSEMNEMNQALKERGENISKLEAHCEEVMKKLQIYEAQANKNVDSITEKEDIIKQLTEEIDSLKRNENSCKNGNSTVDSPKDEEITRLKLEIDSLKERLNSNLDTSYAESEAMSSSTVSRSEDINRMRDLEGSWEERYGKLRNLAIKLKGKVRELTNTLTKEQVEKEEMQKKLSANLKTIQTLQSQSDKLEDALENTKQECKQYLHRLNTIAEDISKDKQALVSKDDLISELNKEVEALKKEKVTTDNWKKQVGAKVQTLRKELQTINLVKKEYEEKITKLLVDSEAKEQALRAEVDSHKQTKSMLDASNNDCKRNSLLSLEMQDYERSVKETAKKLEKQREQVTKLKGQIDSQKSTINALREQNKILEEKVREADDNFNTATAEINTYKKKDARLEEEVARKEDQIHSLTQLLETSRSESEELSTELSKVIAEHQKTNAMLKNERDLLRSQTLGLQQNLRDAQDALKLKEDELRVILTEYEGYKVRAQSVLRQNQIRNIGLEEKLAEEVADLKVRNAQLNSDLEKTIDRIRALEEANDCLSFEKEESFKHVQELEMDVEEIKTQYAQLSNKYQTTVNEHTETVKSLRLHADTLSQCYRQQIAEQEVRHNKEIVELQSRIEKCSSPVETPPMPPISTREEGEGSESIESNNPPKIYPVPLERLLGSDSDQELVHVRKQLVEQESKLLHLTALLADTEQDLAKHVQMNKLLKEEIRRQQRSEEREKHAENLEYLKNVVFKFVTLHSGDERSRMVPVLNTILKLSPEETQKLNIVARGDSGIKGWTNYLPTWSSPNKP